MAPSYFKPCAVCHKDFRVYACEGDARVTCSHACYGVLKRRGLPMQEFTCPVCGNVEVRRPSRSDRPYCSRACYAVARTLPGTPEARRDPKKKRAKDARYRESHRQELNARQLAYHRAHPEVYERNAERRRARLAGAEICDLTRAQWDAIKSAYNHRCAYCGQSPKMLTKDHVVPLAKGGNHTASNIVPACKSCNSRKNTKLIRPRYWPEIEATLRGQS